MTDTRLTAEFAIVHPAVLPASFQAPYRDRQPYIVALNEDLRAWYCWSPEDPEHQQKGDYFVPAWDFGTIKPGASATRRLHFAVPIGGLPSGDTRVTAIEASFVQQTDILLNRTTSLKISTWIDEIALDTGVPYPHLDGQGEEPARRSSDASVFHNIGLDEEEGDCDLGDAPAPFPTLRIHNGARHTVVPGIHLGALIDSEPDGQPDATATGDDLNALADEDGVLFVTSLVAGAGASVDVVCSVPGFISAWIDWNANGAWSDPGEQVYINHPLTPGTNSLPLAVPLPPILAAGGPHSRWRFTTYQPGTPSFLGAESDGEVEDYEVHLQILDFGDAPAPYPTRLAANGARHSIPSGYYLGSPPDSEPDGQPHADALGDDLAGGADEDGVTLVGPLVRGSNAAFQVTASTNGWLNAWLDWAANGNWSDSGDQIATNVALTTGLNMLPVAVPTNAALGQTFARFRFSSYTGLQPTGIANNGEVEDYAFPLYQTGPTTNIVITNIVCATNAGGSVTVQWLGAAPVWYQLEYTADLTVSNLAWTTADGYVAAPPYTATQTNLTGTTNRFYRIVAPHVVPSP